MRKLFIYITILAAFPLGGIAREMTLSLSDAIAMARVSSVDAAVALDELKTAYWQWRSYRADRLPEVNFTATAPSYVNQYSPYMNADGEYSFVGNRYLDARAQLTISQNITLTGGKVSLVSSLDFMHQYGPGGGDRFMTIPVALTLSQPLFGVNTLKWDSRIEPVKYAEAKAAFLSATEDVAIAALSHYFSLILSKANLDIATQNLETASKLYSIALEKRKMGQISENDLLQMELNMLDARADMTNCESTMKSDMFALRSFLGIESDVEIIAEIPTDVPDATVTFDAALEHALANNKLARNMRRRQLEANYEVARTRGDLRQVNLFAQIGYTGTDTKVGDAYSRLRGNQLVEVGVSIPLLDWGKRRGKVKVAESNARVTESRLKQEALDFNQELFVLVERFSNQQRQLEIATRSAEIAARRYNTNVETYMIGRISTLDLNDSRLTKDEAQRSYINELYKFWNYWYQLRSLTLFDFSTGRNINADIERLVNQ